MNGRPEDLIKTDHRTVKDRVSNLRFIILYSNNYQSTYIFRNSLRLHGKFLFIKEVS